MSSSKSFIGRVKWFNAKAGYGFITTPNEEMSSSYTDIFVHHSAVHVSTAQFKYLVEGEYVQFEIEKTPQEKHACRAINVVGVNGGKLMCETRSQALLTAKPRDEAKQEQATPAKESNKKRTEKTNKPKQPRKSTKELVANVSDVKETPKEVPGTKEWSIMKARNKAV
jgi:cold shock CspA family protein